MTDNSLTIADKKPLQKRYCATIGIFITLIIRILEDRFTNSILHEGQNVRQTANKCLQFFCFRGKARIHARIPPGNKRNRIRGYRTFSFLRSDACGSKEIGRTSRGQFRISFRKPFPRRKKPLRSSQSFPPHKRHSHKSTSCGAKID